MQQKTAIFNQESPNLDFFQSYEKYPHSHFLARFITKFSTEQEYRQPEAHLARKPFGKRAH